MKIGAEHSTVRYRRMVGGQMRSFRPICWPDALKVAELLSACNIRHPWFDVVWSGIEAKESLAARGRRENMMEVAAIVLDERYAAPAIERERIPDVIGVDELAVIAELAMEMAELK